MTEEKIGWFVIKLRHESFSLGLAWVQSVAGVLGRKEVGLKGETDLC